MEVRNIRQGAGNGSRRPRVLSIFIFLFAVSYVVTAAPTMEEPTTEPTVESLVHVVSNLNNCSFHCPAGTGSVSGCPSDVSECTDVCSDELTFNDGAHWTCRSCRTCPPNSRVRRTCNATHDTECECERDFYQPESTEFGAHVRHVSHRQSRHRPVVAAPLECRPCELCQHGWGAARPCSPTQNTVCRKCPAGTFSSVLSSSLGCSVCSVCREDQVTISECTPIQDTVCADSDMGLRRVTTKTVETVVPTIDDYNNEGIISVYCAILGAIVLGLLIYVVMKQWRLRNAANKLAHFDPRHGGSSATVPLNSTQSPSDCKQNGGLSSGKFECEISPCGSRRIADGSDGSRGSRGSDSAFVAPGSDGYSRDLKPVTLDTRLRDICTAKRREMEVMLNGRRDQRDWKALARDLGYTSSRIASFEQRAQEKQTGPTRHLFADWAKREDSTVANLLQALCNIGRHDVTLVLLPIQQTSAATLPRTTRYKPISIV